VATTTRTASLPEWRSTSSIPLRPATAWQTDPGTAAGRIPLALPTPSTPGGRFRPKAFSGEVVPFSVTAFREGHDRIGVHLRLFSPSGDESLHRLTPLNDGFDHWLTLVSVLEQGVWRLSRGIAESFGATADARFERIYPATVNDSEAMSMARAAASTVVGDNRVEEMDFPTMGGEDFSFMLEAKQGAYIMLGTASGKGDAGLHHPRYDFNDEVLPTGASYWATLVEQQLPRA
jgi:hypothetical protein